ncbi:hypothetical protein [Mailhella sp.]
MTQDIFLLLIVGGLFLGLIALAVISRKKNDEPARDTNELLFEMYLAYTCIMYETFKFHPESWEAIKKFSILSRNRIIQEFHRTHQQDKEYDMSEHSILIVKSILASLENQASSRGCSEEEKFHIENDLFKVNLVNPREFGRKLFEILQQRVKNGTV